MTQQRRRLLANADATTALGAALAKACEGEAGGVLFLEGDLGAGKTTLARGLLRALGVQGPIRSPTYTLMEPYDLPGRAVLHLDLYRLQDPEELEQLGLADQPPEETLWLVEWPQRGLGYLPAPDARLQLTTVDGVRQARLLVEGTAEAPPSRLAEKMWSVFET